MERIFGYGPGEMLGQSSRIIYPTDEDFTSLGERLYPAIARGESFDEEIPAVRRDGTVFWARLAINALDNADPTHGIVAIFEDISDRRSG
jgi:two-component system sensor histidine kinase/response regulator